MRKGKMTILGEPFHDDETGQLSLARILVAVLIPYCMVAFWKQDVPINWVGLAIALYTANKASSTAKTLLGSDLNVSKE